MPPPGFRPPRLRDDGVHDTHHPLALHHQAQALYLHLGEPPGRETTIWIEGRPMAFVL